MCRYLLFLLCFVCLCIPTRSSGADEKDDTAKAEIKKLQGTWQVTKWVEDSGKDASDDDTKRCTFVFKGEAVDIRHGKDSVKPAYSFNLDPTKKPRWINVDFGVPGEPSIGTGIYKLEDDVLTICLVTGSKSDKPTPRPTEFKVTKTDKFYALFVMKRVKE